MEGDEENEIRPLNKELLLERYLSKCKSMDLEPHKAFVKYLEETEDDNESIDLVIHGNDKENFSWRVKDSDLKPIVDVLEDYSIYVEDIDLRYNEIHDEGAQYLSQLIEKSERLLGLNLQGNSIEINGAQYLAEALKNWELLQYLNLNGNSIQTDGAMNITELLFSHKKLLELNLGNNDINHDGIIGILSVLNCSNYTLEVLNIDNPSYNTIWQSTAIHFGKMLQNNLGIQKLSMKKHKMRCQGTFTIMEHLLENNTLRVLDLTANEIRFQGCEAISKYLKSDTWTLESLHLGTNEWGNYGAKAIAQALPINKSLIHLDMSHNQIEDFGLIQISQALRENSTIMSIKFFGNHFGQSWLELFYDLFRQERENQWYPDFIVYVVDDHYEMAYLETALEMDIHV